MPETSHRRNNFDTLRLLAALSVLFSHAFLMADGSEANEPFVRLTGNQCVLGLVGVFVFFIISGFLVTASWCRNPAPAGFLLRRGLRIFPGLAVNALICALVIGPVVTNLPVASYLADPKLRTFLVHTLTLQTDSPPLPGVLFADNSVGLIVNGSLWTLRYEVMMYLMIVILGLLRVLRLSTCVVLVAIGLAAVYFEKHLGPAGDFGEMAWLVGFFASGMCLYFLRDRIVFDWRGALMALAALAFFVWIGRLIMLFPLAGAYLAIWFALRYDRALDYARHAGDLSYGIYIWGWPVEECVQYAWGGTANWWQVLLCSTALVLPTAWLSWHLVEKRALRWGRRLTARPVVAPLSAQPAPVPLADG
jgi:peptidoglycan/LPS O-acetylase OafA/YrhL